jgi:hypothetical protein
MTVRWGVRGGMIGRAKFLDEVFITISYLFLSLFNFCRVFDPDLNLLGSVTFGLPVPDP